MLRHSVFRSRHPRLCRQAAYFSTNHFLRRSRCSISPNSLFTPQFRQSNPVFNPLQCRAYSSTKKSANDGETPSKKLVTKKKQSSLGKAINATNKFALCIARCFTHPKESWVGFKEGWHHFVDTLKHYWKATKLLWADIKTATSLIGRLARGHKLSWREQRQLKRTILDVLRFIPFMFFVLVPALELALPLVLWLFPNMLPSGFATKHQKEENQKKLLSGRIKYAKFVSSLHSTYLERIEDDEELTKVKAILKKFRRGATVSSKELELIVPFFRDHVTLDNMDRSQLQNICSYLNLTSIGQDTQLRTRLRNRVKWIRKEDKRIAKTGVPNISSSLLLELLQERGMRVDKTPFDLRKDLDDWLNLTQNSEVPTTLLLISRMMMIKGISVDETEALQKTLASLPTAVDEVLVDQAHHEDPEMEKRVLEHHSKLISEEQQFEKTMLTDSEDQQDAKDSSRDLQEEAKLKVVRSLKAAMDESSLDVEREQLEKLKTRHQLEKGKVVSAEKYLADWGAKLHTTFTRDDLLDEEEFTVLWTDLYQFDESRCQEVFDTYDTSKDGLIKVKRAKQAIDEESRRTEEALDEPKIMDYLGSELADDEKETSKEKKGGLLKNEGKLSKRLEKMFEKLEKEIKKSDAKIGSSLKIDSKFGNEELSKQDLEVLLHEKFGAVSKEEMQVLEEFCVKSGSLNKVTKSEIEKESKELLEEEEMEQEEELDEYDWEELLDEKKGDKKP